jgi:hypothetical protein
MLYTPNFAITNNNNMKIRLTLFALLTTATLFAQNLKSFTVTMNPDTLSYLSIKNSKAYSSSAAGDVKTVLDLGLFETKGSKISVLEWFNLKPDNERVPATLTGTKTKVAAISFDRDQFDKCKTVADLKRMTSYLSTNSLSSFAVVRNSSEYYQRCFITEQEDGKRGLIFVTTAGGNTIKVEVKGE